jgi:hypothetical protein
MRKFKTKNRAFFGEYTNARMIVDLGSREEDKRRHRRRQGRSG